MNNDNVYLITFMKSKERFSSWDRCLACLQYETFALGFHEKYFGTTSGKRLGHLPVKCHNISGSDIDIIIPNIS